MILQIKYFNTKEREYMRTVKLVGLICAFGSIMANLMFKKSFFSGLLSVIAICCLVLYLLPKKTYDSLVDCVKKFDFKNCCGNTLRDFCKIIEPKTGK